MGIAAIRSAGASLTVVVLWVAFVPTAQADVALPPVFADHMVLQRNSPLPVWGSAAAGEKVTVTLNGITRTATADARGSWRVDFPPMSARSKPIEIRVSGENTIVLRDVLIGEVWLCSGQSNMVFPLARAASAQQELPAAQHPQIRLFHMVGSLYPNRGTWSKEALVRATPNKYFDVRPWTTCTRESAKDFSAVGYFFGRELHKELKVPVGLIQNAIGGTPTESWIRRDTLRSDPKLAVVLDDWFQNEAIHPFCRQRAANNLALALAEAQKAKAHGPPAPPMPGHPYRPAFMAEAGIEPLVPFAIRGVIWYQGESNSTNVPLHNRLFPALVADWRKAWGQGDFPFLFVQLPGMGTEKGYAAQRWPEFRDGQRRFLSIANTGMAVTIDLGHPTDVHPRKKREVGRRLARWALGTTYKRDIIYSGPLYRSMSIRDAEVVIEFDHVGSGLTTSDGKSPTGFEIAGRDGVYHAAAAKIESGTVVVSSGKVPSPIHVCYAWAPFPRPAVNLINKENLPASPFTTDESPKAGKPNIVLILVDDLGWSDVSYNGSKVYETPHVDRLSRQGMVFTDFYAAGPVCSPTRASILTGKYPARTGITTYLLSPQRDPKHVAHHLALEEVTIAEALKKHGYATGYFGKWHLGYRNEHWAGRQGFDVAKGGIDLPWAWKLCYPDREPPTSKTWPKKHTRFFSPYHLTHLENGPDGEYLTDRLTSETTRFIEQSQSTEQPFFAFLSFHTVHTPLQPKQHVLEKYQQKINTMGLDGKKEKNAREKQWQNNARYAAMVHHMDENVGRLMDALRRMKLEENTIVIFTSDNGGKGSVTSNRPLRGAKHNLQEGGIRVPLIVRWPGKIKAASRSGCPLISNDLYPTLLDLAGCPLQPQQHVDGISFKQILLGGERQPGRECLYWHYPHGRNEGAVRMGDYKLLHFYKTGKTELYNLGEDIGESRDVSGEQPQRTEQMLKKLQQWQRSVGARFSSK